MVRSFFGGYKSSCSVLFKEQRLLFDGSHNEPNIFPLPSRGKHTRHFDPLTQPPDIPQALKPLPLFLVHCKHHETICFPLFSHVFPRCRWHQVTKAPDILG